MGYTQVSISGVWFTSCEACGALVSAFDLQLHDKWHEDNDKPPEKTLDEILDRAWGRMPVVIANRQCPKCLHAWHTQPCLNMASDNDCSCVSSTTLS